MSSGRRPHLPRPPWIRTNLELSDTGRGKARPGHKRLEQGHANPAGPVGRLQCNGRVHLQNVLELANVTCDMPHGSPSEVLKCWPVLSPGIDLMACAAAPVAMPPFWRLANLKSKANLQRHTNANQDLYKISMALRDSHSRGPHTQVKLVQVHETVITHMACAHMQSPKALNISRLCQLFAWPPHVLHMLLPVCTP